MLGEAYKKTEYQLGGNGSRNVKVLKDAFEGVDSSEFADMYGAGSMINDFEKKMADYLRKEAAVFMPSGTMAQQIALRVWCDLAGKKSVAYHPLCHLEIHEQHGLKELHGIEGILLGEAKRMFDLKDLKATELSKAAVTLFELPQREIGGQLPEFSDLVEMTSWCKAQGMKVHLDGARLFETLSYYEKEAAEIAALFDSVYVSFYKGIGGIAGAILAGNQALIDEAKIWKRRHGGDLISLYPYVVTADYYFEKRISKMQGYHESAKIAAALLGSVPGVSIVPEVPVTNMFHVHWYRSKETVEKVLEEVCEKFNVGLSSYVREIDSYHCYFEVSIGDNYEKMPSRSMQQIVEYLKQHFSKMNA